MTSYGLKFSLANLQLFAIIAYMGPRLLHMTVMLVLLTCLVCPVLEMCDLWDHTLRTGQDTEYTLVVLGLCVGVVYALARLIVTFCPNLSAAKYISTLCCIKGSLFLVIRPTALAALSESPPLNLRI